MTDLRTTSIQRRTMCKTAAFIPMTFMIGWAFGVAWYWWIGKL